jgi:hypothetical protein
LPRFALQHSLLGATGALTLLAADFLNAGALGFDEAALMTLDFVEQETTGEKATERLRLFRASDLGVIFI